MINKLFDSLVVTLKSTLKPSTHLPHIQTDMNAPTATVSELKSKLVFYENLIRQGIMDATVMQTMTEYKADIVRLFT